MLIEPSTPDDLAFIVDSWLMSMRDAPLFSWVWVPNGPYFQSTGRRIRRVLESATVLVARPTQQGEGEHKDIAAWICGEKDPQAPPPPAATVPLVHWIYTKQPFRRLGLARQLLGALGWADGLPIVCTSWSSACEAVDPGMLLFRPSLLSRTRNGDSPKAAT